MNAAVIQRLARDLYEQLPYHPEGICRVCGVPIEQDATTCIGWTLRALGESLPTTCCKYVNDQPCGKTAAHWYLHNTDVCSYCPEHDYQCGEKLETQEHATLLSLIASLTLYDHMGDVANDVKIALKRAGITVEWEDLYELRLALGRMGISTLSGVKLGADES